MHKRASIALVLFVGLSSLACDKKSESTPSEGAVSTAPGAAAGDKGPELRINVGASGYEPSSVQAPAGKPAKLVFTRTTDEGCGQQLVFPSLGIRKDLPLNEPVSVDVTMPPSGSLAFTCGMGMFKGEIVAH